MEKLHGGAQHVCGSCKMDWHKNHSVSSLRYFQFFDGLAFYFIMGEIQEGFHAVPWSQRIRTRNLEEHEAERSNLCKSLLAFL